MATMGVLRGGIPKEAVAESDIFPQGLGLVTSSLAQSYGAL